MFFLPNRETLTYRVGFNRKSSNRSSNSLEAFVKFEDYSFFVPKNAQNKEVIVNGKAFVSVESVEDLQHYAKDAGKSQEAIDSITEPKVTYSFMADGVLIAK